MRNGNGKSLNMGGRMSDYRNDREFARRMDRMDPLSKCRKLFLIPRVSGRDAIYFCGNSLGLQPKSTRGYIEKELSIWKEMAVKGHFRATEPWVTYAHLLDRPLSRLTGAKPSEVSAMNSLTVNLHLMLVSFYRPTKKRHKILIEPKAFPSDQYAVDSHLRYHGFRPSDGVIELAPRRGEASLRREDVIEAIHAHGKELALVMMGGVNYYTGQFFDMAAISSAAHEVGAIAGFDLAHAIGNVKLSLHKWNVDFAAWCSYKYLNSGPGGVGGIFVHERHGERKDIPRFAGWCGNDVKRRFLMEREFVPVEGAAGWHVSNAPVLSLAVQRSALEIIDGAGMTALCRKSELLTGYLEFVIMDAVHRVAPDALRIITPANPRERGCQLSLLLGKNGRQVMDGISAAGVVADWREPNVIRLAPAPLYNTFDEVYRFGRILEKELTRLK